MLPAFLPASHFLNLVSHVFAAWGHIPYGSMPLCVLASFSVFSLSIWQTTSHSCTIGSTVVHRVPPICQSFRGVEEGVGGRAEKQKYHCPQNHSSLLLSLKHCFFLEASHGCSSCPGEGDHSLLRIPATSTTTNQRTVFNPDAL